jgi:hypothetical protein
MNKTALILTLALGIGIGFLVARFSATPAVVIPAVTEAPKPVAKKRPPSVFDNRPARTAEAAPAQNEEEDATKTALEDRFKNYREEGRKMIQDMVKNGDREKMGQAFRSAFQNEDFRQVFQRSRELENQWNSASTQEKPAIMDELQSLRTKGVALFKTELDKLDAAPVPAPAATPGAPGVPAPTPAPTVIM